MDEFMTALEVSRSTLTGWAFRAEEDRLEDQRPVPKCQPQKTPVEVIAEVMGMCFKYPERGGVTLSTFLALNGFNYLSPATINRIKKAVREQCGDVHVPLYQRYEFIEPHDAWAVDLMQFKWQGQTVYVLVVLDDCSRFILNWNATTHPTSSFVQATLQETMLRHGHKPKLVKADNGPEFRKQFRSWLADSGIPILPSPFYTPTYNGKVERVNADLRQAVNIMLPRCTTLEQVVGGIAQCIYEHNHMWPHQSLHGVTPYHRLAGMEEIVHTSVEHVKQLERARCGQPERKLILPGQHECPQSPVDLIIPGQKPPQTAMGIVLPVGGRKVKTNAFVRLSIAV